MKTKKKQSSPILPPPPPLPSPLGNTCGMQEPKPMVLQREVFLAEKLTLKVQRHLREIDNLRNSIRNYENRLSESKTLLMTELLNHQQAQHDLERALAVPNQAY